MTVPAPFGHVPREVEVVEVGPRDGLQNESGAVATADKVQYVELLAEAGFRRIEATSFVSPRAVPQLADAAEVMAALRRRDGLRYLALVPNMKGMERALAAGVRDVAVFTGATDSFTRRNVNMTIEQSIAAFRPVVALAREHAARLRGYVSVCFGCPYEGQVTPERVLEVASRLLDLGVDELALGDTIGVATPNQVPEVAGPVAERAGPQRVALHFHDTRGTALANVLAALQLGVSTFDAAAGGLGGCPYAPGAAGNLATEDLLYLLHGMGIRTGVDMHKVAEASRFMAGVLGRPVASKVLQALDAAEARSGGAAGPVRSEGAR
jgi:hydroxymethylglutaryl-CoA lyase